MVLTLYKNNSKAKGTEYKVADEKKSEAIHFQLSINAEHQKKGGGGQQKQHTRRCDHHGIFLHPSH